jgi:hypothetical protein
VTNPDDNPSDKPSDRAGLRDEIIATYTRADNPADDESVTDESDTEPVASDPVTPPEHLPYS